MMQEEKLQFICYLLLPQTFGSNFDAYIGQWLSTGVNGPGNSRYHAALDFWLHSCSWLLVTWNTCRCYSSHLANTLSHCSFSVCLLPISGNNQNPLQVNHSFANAMLDVQVWRAQWAVVPVPFFSFSF